MKWWIPCSWVSPSHWVSSHILPSHHALGAHSHPPFPHPAPSLPLPICLKHPLLSLPPQSQPPDSTNAPPHPHSQAGRRVHIQSWAEQWRKAAVGEGCFNQVLLASPSLDLIQSHSMCVTSHGIIRHATQCGDCPSKHRPSLCGLPFPWCLRFLPQRRTTSSAKPGRAGAIGPGREGQTER